jgi:PAS domain S-box-containing protein
MTEARILIVEDDHGVALDLQDRLTRFGYSVAAKTALGDQAIRLAEELQPDIVLIDISLAGNVSGVAVAQEIRRHVQTQVIYLTTGTDQAAIEGLAGRLGYLLKPIRERELLSVIELALCQRVAEFKVRKAEEKYRSIFENAVEGIFQSTPDGRYLAVNPAMARIAGYGSPEEMVASGEDIHQRSFVDPERRREYKRLLAAQGHVHGFEFEAYRKDGSRHWVAEHTRSVCGDSGKLLYYEGAVEDVTERKRLQEESRQAHKMEAIGQLAGGVAHDFNNLMTVVLGCSEVVLRKVAPDDPIRFHLVEIQKAGERAAAVTSQLLAFSRKQILRPQVLDLNLLVTETEMLCRRLIRENIHFSIQLEPALHRVEADAGQVQQILMNLVVNARDAMPRGGELTIETANVEFTDRANDDRPGLKPGSYVQLSVRDTGCGMTPEVRARLFEPFFTTKEFGKGTGLGLATVYGIVKQSKGHIYVESAPGRGARFDVFLPRSSAKSGSGSEDRPVDAPPGGAETILLVEDEEPVRKLAASVLEDAGYTVLPAGDAEDALRIAKDHARAIDLLLTDVVMPGMDGWDLAANLRAVHPSAKVLYTSGYSEYVRTTPVDCRNPNSMLNKPFTPRTLVRRVRDALDHDHAGRALVR